MKDKENGCSAPTLEIESRPAALPQSSSFLLHPSSFFKYAGCGNDFILFDNRDLWFPEFNTQDNACATSLLIQKLCDRRHGIGADGVILLELSDVAHFRMRIFNSDGSEAEMCGNGIRCLTQLARKLGVSGSHFDVQTMNGIYSVKFQGDEICVNMGPPSKLRWNISVAIGKTIYTCHFLNTGVPHVVLFVDDIERVAVEPLGRLIRHHPDFSPAGTNVNFVQLSANGELCVRTYERGVEAETLACGTGATATALAAVQIHGLSGPLRVKVRSGDLLTIDFEGIGGHIHDVSMTGPATFVYQGVVDLPVESKPLIAQEESLLH